MLESNTSGASGSWNMNFGSPPRRCPLPTETNEVLQNRKSRVAGVFGMELQPVHRPVEVADRLEFAHRRPSEHDQGRLELDDLVVVGDSGPKRSRNFSNRGSGRTISIISSRSTGCGMGSIVAP